MKPNITNTPPNWQKDAVPSARGWRHPRTGELLVSVKLDMTQFEEKEPKVEKKEEVKEAVVETKQVPKRKTKKNDE